MTTVNARNPKTDQSVEIFDKFYSFSAVIPQAEYDIIYSYLASVFATKSAAANFTVTLFRISQEASIPVMDLLQQIQGQSQPQITMTLAYYLNNMRSPSTLLGLNAPVTPNFYVARNCRA